MVAAFAFSLLLVALPSKARQAGPLPIREGRNGQNGVWRSQHIIIEVTESGASITYDCADGIIDHPMKLDNNGRFEVRGTLPDSVADRSPQMKNLIAIRPYTPGESRARA